MPINNYTTTVKVDNCIAKIQKLLQQAGCEEITIRFELGAPKSLTFGSTTSGRPLWFRLPANPDGVLVAMKRDKKVPRNLCTYAQAEKVAWRNIEDWIRAQLAIIESGQVTTAEVFLPYALDKDGKTLYNNLLDNKLPLLK